MHHKTWVCPDPKCKSTKLLHEKYCEGWSDDGGEYYHSRINYNPSYEQESFYNQLLSSTVWLLLYNRPVTSDVKEENREAELRRYVKDSTLARKAVEENLQNLKEEVKLLRKVLSS